jgi:hypothetical protein
MRRIDRKAENMHVIAILLRDVIMPEEVPREEDLAQLMYAGRHVNDLRDVLGNHRANGMANVCVVHSVSAARMHSQNMPRQSDKDKVIRKLCKVQKHQRILNEERIERKACYLM